MGRESRKVSRKYEIYKLFKAVSLGDICKDLYMDQKPGIVMAEPGHSYRNRKGLRETGEPENRRKIKRSVGENSVSGRRK